MQLLPLLVVGIRQAWSRACVGGACVCFHHRFASIAVHDDVHIFYYIRLTVHELVVPRTAAHDEEMRIENVNILYF